MTNDARDDLIQIFAGITRVARPFKGILLDAYGVFWEGNACGLLPGSKEVMEQLYASGKIVGILSNSTQIASKEMEKLAAHGLVQGKHFHFFVTSGEMGRNMLLHDKLPFETPRKTFWLFGGDHPKHAYHEAIFRGTSYRTSPLHEADFIYINVPHLHGEDQTDPELFRKEVERISRHNLPMICLNPDRFAHEGKPVRAVVRQGSIARMYEEMGGKVYYIGKPGLEAYKQAMREFEKYAILTPQDILMVGDTPETDIRGARLFGMFSALIMRTGMMAERIAHEGLESTLFKLSFDDYPDFFLERLIDDL